ncbi:hypothetical protein ACFQZT_10650 [Paenibacillus sp. GCM10027628]|uniref:hypothetical protein n=1 Tax=Paenibacillus sp. GCM10027628 TaxID=3273413 RepID=UPI003632D228
MGSILIKETDIGSLEIGKMANLFLVRVDEIDCSGTHKDPKSLLSTIGLKRPVNYTIVNGRSVVENGKLAGLDEKELFVECQQSFERFIAHT